MLTIPDEIERIRRPIARQHARCRHIWNFVKAASGAKTWRELSVMLDYQPTTVAVLKQRPVISGGTAKKLQALCGKDAEGRWIAPKEIISPDHFGDE